MKNIVLFLLLVVSFIPPTLLSANNMDSYKTIDFFMLKNAALQNCLADSLATIIAQPSDWENISPEDGFDILIIACDMDLTGTALRYLIEKGIDLQYRSKRYRGGPLHYAAQTGSLASTKLLVENGQDVNEKRFAGDPPLFHAARSGSLDVVKYLIQQGAVLNAEQSNTIFNAAGYGHYDIFKYMVEQLREELDWQECLRRAILGCNPEIIDYLIVKKKVDINQPINNEYPIEIATAPYISGMPVMRYLLSKGARIEDINNGELFPWAFHNCSEEALICILEHTENPPIQYSGGGEEWCGLAEALDKGWFKLAEWLLNYETDYTFRGRPLLIYFADELEDSSRILTFLIEHKINSEYLSEALLHAATHDNVDAIETLLNAGADINFEQNGDNALCLANDYKTAELLIEKGINTRHPKFIENLWLKPDVLMAITWNNVEIEFSQEMKDKGLNHAARACHHGAAGYYMLKGADPNYFHPTVILRRYMTEEDKIVGMTALMVYVTFKPSSGDMIKELIQAGAEVILANEEGMTALHYAAMPNRESSWEATDGIGTRQDRENGAHAHNVFPYDDVDDYLKTHTEEILGTLLKAGAEVNAVDNEGKTPLQRAIETDNTFAIDLLKRAGGK